jgi:pyridinium-3,5-bisthiocarboxylic acid mononucleotide nickel chelatase
MRTIHFDCASGASGDMILGALVDAGANREAVQEALEALDLPGWTLTFEEVQRGSQRALQAKVTADTGPAHRHLSDIRSIIANAALDERIAELAMKVFERLAAAEARVHGTSIEEVHFHEVGALDAIVDVVGCAAALLSLEPERVSASAIDLGTGSLLASHGQMAVPGPAVTELISGFTVFQRGEGELLTPTGAAFLAEVATSSPQLPPMELETSGYGAGGREGSPLPNVLRVFVGNTREQDEGGHLLLETNIDDMAPEFIPFAIERLIEAGAQDAWSVPITMKKGRLGFALSVLCESRNLNRILDVLYAETTTLGVRIGSIGKDELVRSFETVSVEGFEVAIKIGYRRGREVTASPEFEDAAKVARITGLPLKEVYRLALQAREDI